MGRHTKIKNNTRRGEINMSEEEFTTTGNLGKSEKELADLVKKGDETSIQLIMKNRKVGLEGLQRKVEGLENTIDRLPADHMVVTSEGNKPFNLKTALTEILQGLQSTLTGIEAVSSLDDMIIHDLAGCIHNIEKIGSANWQTGAHFQVLVEILKEKELITDEEMRAMWDKLVPAAVAEMKKHI